MPYIMLMMGIAVALYALYRFFSKANPHQIAVFLKSALSMLLLCGSLFLALTGRVGAAMAIAAALIPVLAGWRSAAKQPNINDGSHRSGNPSGTTDTIKTRAEALEVLGLAADATEADIHDAYRTLMKKIHPDHGGNDYLAGKINEARNFLLKDGG